MEGRWGPHKWVGVGRRGPPQALDAAEQTYRIILIGQKVLPDPNLLNCKKVMENAKLNDFDMREVRKCYRILFY